MSLLRIGTLGSSRISRPALIDPATSVADVTVAAVAARDKPRAEGQLGPVRHLQAWTNFAITNPGDIRYDFDLGGGALMDGGCYALDCLRLLGASDEQDEPTVTGALADPVAPDPRGAAADRSAAVRLAFPGGATGWFESPFTRDGEFRADLHVICEDGLVWLDDFIFPHRGRLRATGAVQADEEGGGDTTYVHQPRAFAAAIADGQP